MTQLTIYGWPEVNIQCDEMAYFPQLFNHSYNTLLFSSMCVYSAILHSQHLPHMRAHNVLTGQTSA